MARADGWSLVAGEVVHHDHVAGRELGHEHLVDIGLEGVAVDRTVEDHGRDDARRGAGPPRRWWSSNGRAGCAARSRSPFGARPRSRAMLVEAQVSSMKTSRSGSRSSWPSNQASRRFRTSGRSCSAAWAVFF